MSGGNDLDNEPTPERMGQYGDEADFFKTETGRIIKRLNPLDALYSNANITGEGYIAAGLYLKDAYDGGMMQRSTADPSREVVDGGGSGDAFHAKRMDAAKRFASAKAYVKANAGPRAVIALEKMLLDDWSMTRFAREILGDKTSKPARRGRYTLSRAINCLADHYAPAMPAHVNRYRTMRPAGAKPSQFPQEEN